MSEKTIANIKCYMDKCKRDNIGAFAAQSAFFMILSLIPFMMFLTSLLQYTPITQEYLIQVVQESMPAYIEPMFISVIDEVYTRNVGLLSVTAVLAIWAAGRAIQYLTAALNAVHDIYETRNWLVVRCWSVVYTLAFVLALVILLVFSVFADEMRKLIPDNLGAISLLVHIQPLVRGLMIYGILCLMFTVLFMALPNKKLSFVGQLPGGVICATAWYVFTFFLSVYVDYFHGFSMYGSMTTLALLMLWFYVCMYIMLLCAEGNVFFAEIRNKT